METPQPLLILVNNTDFGNKTKQKWILSLDTEIPAHYYLYGHFPSKSNFYMVLANLIFTVLLLCRNSLPHSDLKEKRKVQPLPSGAQIPTGKGTVPRKQFIWELRVLPCTKQEQSCKIKTTGLFCWAPRAENRLGPTAGAKVSQRWEISSPRVPIVQQQSQWV